ncbi:MAG: Thioredoxin reductase, partial [uncultured Blastococcus sp.]
GQSGPAGRGRRSAGARRGGARPARPLRRALPGDDGVLRRPGAGPPAPAAAARGPRRPAPGRPADAGHERHRVPGGVPAALPRRAPRAPDRLRRHRGRHPGHQRRRRPSLPAQAVGPARGPALPGARRPAGDLAPPAAHGEPAADRRPLVPGHPRGAPVPGPEPGALPVAGRGDRRLRARAARRRPGRRRRAAGHGPRGRRCADPAGSARGRPADRPARARRAGRLRPGDRRRRARGAGRRRVRRVRGPVDPAAGVQCARWAGRHHHPDRELPRVPGGALGRRPHPAGARAGDPVRRGDAGAQRGGRPGPGRSVHRRPAGRRDRGERLRAGHRLGGDLPDPRRPRRGRADGHGALLRRRARRGRGAHRRAGLRRGWWQLGGSGGGVPVRVRRLGHRAGPRRRPRQHDVALPDRPDRGIGPDQRRGGDGGRRGARRATGGGSTAAHRGGGAGRPRRGVVRLRRAGTENRLAGRRGAAGLPGLRADRGGPRSAARGLAAARATAAPGDIGAPRLRRRRRPARLDEADRVGGRRGGGGGQLRPRAAGGPV